jgi:lipopolysaccharide transport system ATP-binding protein
LLDAGRVQRDGPADQVVSSYIQTNTHAEGEVAWREDETSVNSDRLRLVRARILVGGQVSGDVPIDQEAMVEYEFQLRGVSCNVTSSIHLFDKQGVWVLCSGPVSVDIAPGSYCHRVTFPANFLNDGIYTLSIILLTNVTQIHVYKREAISFCVFETGTGRGEYGGIIHGCVRPLLAWQTGPVPPPSLHA